MNDDIIDEKEDPHPWTPQMKEVFKNISDAIRKSIFTTSKSNCPNCELENCVGTRYVAGKLPGICSCGQDMRFHRTCDSCKTEWTTDE